jgi:muskelin
LFDWYASQQPYSAEWKVVSPCSADLVTRLIEFIDRESSPELPPSTLPPLRPPDMNSGRPGRRGGHQMVMDSATNTLYLFGGWDGEIDLSDLWSYHVPDKTWDLICKHCENISGPSARSCHKMVLDEGRRQIFTIGRYLDVKHRSGLDTMVRDFSLYV